MMALDDGTLASQSANKKVVVPALFLCHVRLMSGAKNDSNADRELTDSVSLALHLNSKCWPKRRKHIAIDYSEYGRLAKEVVAQLKLSGWRFWKKPPSKQL